jgi:hypothetical protein
VALDNLKVVKEEDGEKGSNESMHTNGGDMKEILDS